MKTKIFKSFCFVISLAFVATIGYFDFKTGYTVTLMIFYLIPVSFAAMTVGSATGILAAILSGIVWLTADLLSGHPYPNIFEPVWNMVVRTIFFFFPVYVIERIKIEKELKKYHANLESLINERTSLLQESEEKYRSVVDNIGIGVSLISPNMEILALNAQMKKWFPGIDITKKPFCYRAFNRPPRKDICSYCPTCKTLKDGKTYEATTETPADDKVVNYRIISSPIKDNEGRILAAVEMVEDITERSYRDKELRKYQYHLEELVNGRTRALEESEKKFRLAFENATDAILWADPETGILVNCNKAAEELFEKPRNEIIGKHQSILHPADKKEYYIKLFKDQAVNKTGVAEGEILIKSGKIKTALISCSLTEIENRRIMQGVFHDITRRKEIESALEVSRESYRSIFESANDAIIVRDIKTYKVLDVNNRACELFCYPKEAMIGLDLQAVIPGDNPHALESVWNHYDKAVQGEPQIFEQLVKDKMGRTFWVEVSLRRAIIGDRYCLLAITRDITERKESENKIVELNDALAKANENLKHLALRDSHTGLYNHHYFVDAIEAELERAKRHSEELSLIMMDIDYFKSINDVYGHQFGDAILKQFAKLLRKEVRIYDIVVRFGGEEFIVISPDTSGQEALTLAQRILDTVATHSFGDKKHTVKIKISSAVSSYPSDKQIACGTDFVDLADQILNRAKEDGGNRAYSSADLEAGRDGLRPIEEPSVDVLKGKLKKLTARGNQSVVEAIFAFAKTIELKDRYTGEHVEKTIHYATGIAESLGLPKHEIEIIKEASILHDLGKIGVPEKILLKTGKLTKQEREVIKEHPQIGADILRPVHFLRDIIPVVLHHHEWWNGEGYPNGLKKEAIPIGARIVAIADVYQALTSDRPYHKAYPKEEALNIIKNGSGTQFEPKIVDAFLGILGKE